MLLIIWGILMVLGTWTAFTNKDPVISTILLVSALFVAIINIQSKKPEGSDK